LKSQKLLRNKAQQRLLERFLESPACPANTMNFYQLDGYLRAICCGPGLAYPSEWLPLVFNDGHPQYSTEAEAEQVMEAIMALYNFHSDQVLTAECTLPLAANYSALKSERTDLEQWARGFLQGYIHWQEYWDSLLAPVPTVQADSNIDLEDLADELDAVLYILSTVADAELALTQGTKPEDLAGIFACLPETLIACGRIGQELYRNDLANTNSQKSAVLAEQFTRESAKVERNELCSCGSGKKFKKCCLH
jgi:uncharacterized protein